MRTPWSDRSWTRVAVYGLGLSGRSAARFLRGRGVDVVAFDRRSVVEDLEDLQGDSGVELFLGSEPDRLPEGIDGVILSPGIPPGRPLLVQARAAGLPVVGEIELGFAYLDGPVLAVTGSNGKSTTTALAGALLAASGFAVEVCGNIGQPLTACVEGPKGRIFVVELSSFQLESVVTFRPRAAALLNLSPDHLDRHPEMDSYLEAKSRIFGQQRAEDVAILNADDPYLQSVQVASRRRLFSRQGPVADGCWVDGSRVMESSPGQDTRVLFDAADVHLVGTHNLENAMASSLLALAAGASLSAFPAALRDFVGLPHRMERVAERRGVLWLDDSKGTNLEATSRSLEGFEDRRVHLILGGRSKGTDPAELIELVRRKAKYVYLVGEAAPEFAAAMGESVPWETAGTLDRAVQSAASRSEPGDVVLLSPACSSFDQYRNFEERGDHFQSLVHSLEQGGEGGEHG